MKGRGRWREEMAERCEEEEGINIIRDAVGQTVDVISM